MRKKIGDGALIFGLIIIMICTAMMLLHRSSAGEIFTAWALNGICYGVLSLAIKTT